MENIILGFLGKHNDISIFVNMGKYGVYLNYDEKLYSVPTWFQTDKFNVQSAIKIIEYKSKLIKEEKKLKMIQTMMILILYIKKIFKKTSNE